MQYKSGAQRQRHLTLIKQFLAPSTTRRFKCLDESKDCTLLWFHYKCNRVLIPDTVTHAPREKSSQEVLILLCPELWEKPGLVPNRLNQKCGNWVQLAFAPIGSLEFQFFSRGSSRAYLFSLESGEQRNTGTLHACAEARIGSGDREKSPAGERQSRRQMLGLPPKQESRQILGLPRPQQKENCAWKGEGKLGLPRKWACPGS